ncbi:hypothetical protein [Aquabacterium sp.]|uniref:hypothetical protein n=1 Tax=Aquabacterium sp. TaxID=1872578 RepID=UPI0035B18A8D
MTRFTLVNPSLRPLITAALLALSGAAAQAQTAGPPASGAQGGNTTVTIPVITKQTTGARQGAATAAGSALQPRPLPGVRGGLITEVGSGRAIGEGSRVLTVPGKCTPKAHSLDCASETAQDSGGADVSGRVRKGVIGEVGAGKATTEGAGKAQGSKTCTPAPGKLTCE